MSRLFSRNRSSSGSAPHEVDHDPNSAYLSLLDPDHDHENGHGHEHESGAVASASVQRRPSTRHRRLRSLPQEAMSSRSWLAAATESRSSWTGERPPGGRKLVKENQNGTGRPSFSLELSDSDVEKEKGIVRRQIARLKEFYRRAEKPSAA
jgi:hypothetical protein